MTEAFISKLKYTTRRDVEGLDKAQLLSLRTKAFEEANHIISELKNNKAAINRVERAGSNYAAMLNIVLFSDLKRGEWIFTCGMQPQQFHGFEGEKNPDDYKRSAFTDDSWEQFAKYNDFTTIGGGSHSLSNCGCRRVSDAYAQWFIKNECWNLFPNDRSDEQWDAYENAVRTLCDRDGITYEGI